MRRQVVASALSLSLLAWIAIGAASAPPSGTGNADRVDGYHAVGAKAALQDAAGALVAHNAQGVIPRRFVPGAGDAQTLDGLDSTELDAATLDGLDSTDLVAEIVGIDAGGGSTLSTSANTSVASLSLAPGTYLLEFHASPAITGGWGSVECAVGGRQESFWVVGEALGGEQVHVTVGGDLTIATVVAPGANTTYTAECWLAQVGNPAVVGDIAGAVSDVSMYAIQTEEFHSGSNT
ncbi:MAG TPA: hypothetical protein VF235_07430 [Actinomycetota bacterium]